MAAIISLPACSQSIPDSRCEGEHFVFGERLDSMMKKPECLRGYFSNQTGPLTKILPDSTEVTDSTFTVEQIKIPSDGLSINGWLYLPLGNSRCPLIVLTNGGGDDSRPIKSLSDWIAPILAHCGVAAFVHDKRGCGLSEGNYAETTYEDYITDAGNCGIYLANHPRVDATKIGVMGGSEGGRVAVIAAHRYPVFSFVISLAGTVVSQEEDRLYATQGGQKERGIPDSVLRLVEPLWKRSFAAWASHDPAEHAKVDKEIMEWRERFEMGVLPLTKMEMDTIPHVQDLLPTWNSLGFDYMSEMELFNKKWLAIFGEEDHVVPTEASVKNILKCMSLSGNEDFSIVVLPECGHAPVNKRTRRMIRIDNLVLHWLEENGIHNCNP